MRRESSASNFARSRLKVALLTGLSDPRNCRLSYVQHRFLASLVVPDSWKVWANFPFGECDPDRADPRLWRACAANVDQFIGARTRTRRAIYRRSLTRLAASSEEGVVLIAGSCGLEIFNALGAEVSSMVRHVLSTGPVAWRRPVVPHTMIQGSRDPISRLFFRHVDVVVDGVGHMGYLSHPTTLSVVNRKLAELAATPMCSPT